MGRRNKRGAPSIFNGHVTSPIGTFGSAPAGLSTLGGSRGGVLTTQNVETNYGMFEPSKAGDVATPIYSGFGGELPKQRMTSMHVAPGHKALVMSPLIHLAGSATKHNWWLVGKPRETIKAFALNMLRESEIGSFLIREVASTPGCLGLTVKVSNRELINYLIKPHQGEVTIRGTKEAFPDIPSLINFYCAMKRASMPVKLVSGVKRNAVTTDSKPQNLDLRSLLTSTAKNDSHASDTGSRRVSGETDDFFTATPKQVNVPEIPARNDDNSSSVSKAKNSGTDHLYLEAKRDLLIEQRKRMALERKKRALEFELKAASPSPSSVSVLESRASPSANSSISQVVAKNKGLQAKQKFKYKSNMLPIEEDPALMWQKISSSKASHRDKLAAAQAQLEYLRQQEKAVQHRLAIARNKVHDPKRQFKDNATVFDENFENGTVVDQETGEVFGFGADEENEVFGFH